MKLSNADFDDRLIRNRMVEDLGPIIGRKLKSNDNEYLIDLVCEDDPTIGVELEHGRWDGDFWVNKYYAFKSNLEFPTINIPQRKQKLWKDHYYLRGGKKVDNPGFKEHRFVRTNMAINQIIMIEPEAILNGKFMLIDIFCKNSGKHEPFMCFKREDVKTYNKINDKFMLQ